MKVILRNNLFLGDKYYYTADNPNDIPNELRDSLPKTATIVEKYTPPTATKPPVDTLRDFDTVRAQEEDVEKLLKKKTKATS